MFLLVFLSKSSFLHTNLVQALMVSLESVYLTVCLYFSFCLCVCLSFGIPACLFVCLSVYLPACLFACLANSCQQIFHYLFTYNRSHNGLKLTMLILVDGYFCFPQFSKHLLNPFMTEANHWTGFYMISASIMKGLTQGNGGCSNWAQKEFFCLFSLFLLPFAK